MEAGPQQLLALTLLGAGVALGAIKPAWISWRLNINARVFAVQIAKQVEGDNIQRALKLCTAGFPALVPRGTAGMLLAFQQGVADPASLRDAFDNGAGGIDATLKRFAWAPPLGVVAAAAGTVMAISGPDGARPVHYLMGAGALFLAIFSYMSQASLKAKTLAARDALIKSFTRGA